MLEGFTVLLFSLHNLSCLLPWDPIFLHGHVFLYNPYCNWVNAVM
jgi:hypothetical protein